MTYSPLLFHVVAGSDEYYNLKIGMPTASQFHNLVTPGGKPTTGERRRKYMMRLIAERLFHQTFDDRFENYWTRRGKELEPQAVHAFEKESGLHCGPGGFMMTPNKKAGCSPDRLIAPMRAGQNSRAALEIKCTAPWQHVEYLLDGPGTNYKPQVQGQIFVGGFDCVHLFAYHPGAPSFNLVTLRDEGFIEILQHELAIFCRELDHETARARKLGPFALAETLRLMTDGDDGL